MLDAATLTTVFTFLGAGGVLLAVFAFLFRYVRNDMRDESVRQRLDERVDKHVAAIMQEMQDQIRVAEAARMREAAAVSEIKKWEAVVDNLKEDIQELREQLKQSEKSNAELRQYIHDVMKSVQSFSVKRPDAISDLSLPDIPVKGI